jgi:hypothetical protein
MKLPGTILAGRRTRAVRELSSARAVALPGRSPC